MNYTLVIIVVVLAWIYDFYNGANDCANAIATTISSRVLSPFKAILLASFFNVLGAFIVTRVAETIGKGLLDETHMTNMVVISSIVAAIIWASFATHTGIPVSITHCIVGGIVGSGFAAFGYREIRLVALKKVLLAMVLSPLYGFCLGLILIILIFWIFRNRRPYFVNKVFGKLQIVSASFMAYAHGTNDTQNAMGIITASLLAGGFLTEFKVPFWVILGSGLMMGLGTFYGGRLVIKTMGMRLTQIRPVQGFAAETSASIVIFICSLLGLPISTTHIISTSIMGVGSSRRLSAVRWGIAGKIVVAWILTLPVTALMAYLIYHFINLIF